MDVSHDERDAAFDAAGGRRVAGAAGLRLSNGAFKTVDAEISPARGEVCLRNLGDRDGRHK